MPKKWTDAEFEVVGNQYRPGERHRDPKRRRWFFTGRYDKHGTPLWYRRPLLNRPMYFLAVVAAIYVILGAAGLYDHLRHH